MLKYMSPGSWFSLEYPLGWHEFEDAEDSFLFYNPDKWSGNFRISAFRGEHADYAAECVDYELQNNVAAKRVQVAGWACAFSKEDFQEEGVDYTSYLWVTGKGEISIECSFTVNQGESPKIAEQIIESLKVRKATDKPWKEVIPLRVLEINSINEAYEWAVATIKKQTTKGFSAQETDLANLQRVIDSGKFNKTQRPTWESFGIVFGTILVNEMDGMDWVTFIDGSKEMPALRFADSKLLYFPTEMIWNKVRKGESCDLMALYAQIKEEVEKVLAE